MSFTAYVIFHSLLWFSKAKICLLKTFHSLLMSFFQEQNNMFLRNLIFFSVSKVNLSEYSEKIEALAARLTSPVVWYYFVDFSLINILSPFPVFFSQNAKERRVPNPTPCSRLHRPSVHRCRHGRRVMLSPPSCMRYEACSSPLSFMPSPNLLFSLSNLVGSCTWLGWCGRGREAV